MNRHSMQLSFLAHSRRRQAAKQASRRHAWIGRRAFAKASFVRSFRGCAPNPAVWGTPPIFGRHELPVPPKQPVPTILTSLAGHLRAALRPGGSSVGVS